MDEFSVCFTDPVLLDMDVYSLWLEGMNDEEASRHRKHVDTTINVPLSLVLNDTREQFQLFHLLEKFLSVPLSFKRQTLCPLTQPTQQMLIERYYSYDKEVIREILGRKMSAKLRKDMDDVSEKTGIPLKRCRRQFDNVKNVLKAYEDSEGGALEIITKQFLLSESLASVYALVVFIFVNRFDTIKKRLAYLTFDDLIFCGEQMLNNWCIGQGDSLNQTPDILREDDELDRNFFQEVRDLKNIITDKEINDQLKNYVVTYLEKQNLIGLSKSVDSVFRTLMQKIFHIGASMSNSRDVRDFFAYSVEKVIEPVKQMEWSKHEFEMFLDALVNVNDELKHICRSNARKTASIYLRFLTAMKACLLRMYHS